MVVHADTAVEPLAVVVEAIDAPVADVAVAALLRSEDLTGGAYVTLIKVLVKFKESYF